MRKIYILFIIILIILLTPIAVIAHSGKTDSNGGHTNHSTGEYHYHHGYSAHDHWDMDDDGDLDCPYNFVDKTGSSSGAGYGSVHSSSLYKEGYDKGYEDGKLDGHQDGYAQAKETLQAEYKNMVNREQIPTAIGTLLLCVVIAVPVTCALLNRRSEQERSRYNEELQKAKENWIKNNNSLILQRITPGAKECVHLPDGVHLDLKCTPIKGTATAERPYGNFTAYISAKGTKYHYRKGCCGAVHPIHVLGRSRDLTPCSICIGRDVYESIPEWYSKLQGQP